jgi:Ser/Thr protein kinase RdoA (MazF antagonist)
LPKDDDSYGLIHQDVHGGNFFVDDNGDIMLFDFDDCVYGWYVYDIAMVVFYMVTNHPDPVGLATAFWPHFWRGYQQENDLDPAWLAEMPAFFKLREVDLYGIIHRSFDVENVTDEWAAQFMDGRRQRIEQDNPYIDIDFTRLA